MVRLVRLGDFCEQDRNTVRRGERSELRYIGLETIESGTGQLQSGELSKTPDIPQANSFRFGPEHVLYGKLRPYLNKVAVPDFEGKCSTEIIPLRPKSGLDRRYLSYFLRSTDVVDRISKRTAGSRMPRADMDFVLELKLPLPPLDEQRRIVDLLSRAEGIVRLRREAQKKAAEIIPALFLDMFGDPVTNPKEWKKGELKFVCQVSYGIADKLDSTVTAEQGVRILTISNVQLDGTIDFTVERFCTPTPGQIAKASVRKGDLLFNWRNGSEIHVGKTAIWDRDQHVLHVSFLLRLRSDTSRVTAWYLWSLLNYMRASGYFVGAARQQVNRKFNASELSDLPIPLPPIPKQEAFAEKCQTVFSIRRQHDDATTKATTAFNALLARVFSNDGDSAMRRSVEVVVAT